MKSLLVFVWILYASLSVFGQEKCATNQFNRFDNTDQSALQFEDWLKDKIDAKALLISSKTEKRIQEEIYEIPVVVHVVNQGEFLGTRSNIPDDQILSQIQTLNEDFRRLNDDRENTPAIFEGVAADVNIHFVLAKRDPEGLPTDGIVRTQGTLSEYDDTSMLELSNASYWPAEEYLNIWVTTIKSPFIGFAFFPFTNAQGVLDQDKNVNRLKDGAVIDYKYFGTGSNALDFSTGRTLTHEIGHWLGLRHIWGDNSSCTLDDYCTDTPFQSRSYTGQCPSGELNSCSNDDISDMYQNFMDYTDDKCMNLFTECQANRMRLVLEESPRRKSLLASLGGMDAVQKANDLGIRAINSPFSGNCMATFIPEIEVRNYGTNEINSFNIELFIDEVLFDEYEFVENIDLLEATSIQFPEMSYSEIVTQMTFKISKVNTVDDGNQENDCQWISARFPKQQQTPFEESFNDFDWSLTGWSSSLEGSAISQWSVMNAPNEDLNNTAAVLNCFNSGEDQFGDINYLYSPVFVVSDFPNIDLSFDYAYSGTDGDFTDALGVVYSTDCGETFPDENIVFYKLGSQLLTASSNTGEFIPDGREDWNSFSTTLRNDIFGSELVIAFVGYNGGGNNVFIDNVKVTPLAIYDYDIGAVSLNNMGLISCDDVMSPDVLIRNFGKIEVNELTLTYQLNGLVKESVISNLSLESGASQLFSLGEIALDQEDDLLEIVINNPNKNLDDNQENDTIRAYFEVDTSSILIPFREQFKSEIDNLDWILMRTDALPDWLSHVVTIEGEENRVVLLPGYDIIERGVSNWMISPILDLSSLDSASFYFDISYANRIGKNDQINVWGSVNCGKDFDYLLYSKKGIDLAVAQQEIAWSPSKSNDWKKEYVSLTDVAGFPDVRLGLEVINENGNNMYFDNFEFFVSDNEDKVWIEHTMAVYPNPASDYIEVTFNFNIQESVEIRLFSMNGKEVYGQVFDQTLNQTYRLYNIDLENGMYILHTGGRYTDLSSKIFIKR